MKLVVFKYWIFKYWIAPAAVGLAAATCGCDSKQPAAATGSASNLAHASTTSGGGQNPSDAGSASNADPMSISRLAPPMLAPRRDDLVALEVSAAEYTAVEEDARKLNDAFYRGDVETVVRLRHPRFIEKTGGPEAAIDKLREERARIAERGVQVESFEILRRPIFLKTTIREYVLVPTKRVLSNGTDRIERFNFELGSREIGNPTWAYVDGAQLSPSNINALFPDFPADRRLPEVLTRKLETVTAR